MEAGSHGPRISAEEYERRLIALETALPSMPTKEQDRITRRAALGLAIDHRLGAHFPAERRAALWAVQERVERRRLRLALKTLFTQLFSRNLAGEARGLARGLVREYAKVLNRRELDDFFGADEVRDPALPVDDLR